MKDLAFVRKALERAGAAVAERRPGQLAPALVATLGRNVLHLRRSRSRKDALWGEVMAPRPSGPCRVGLGYHLQPLIVALAGGERDAERLALSEPWVSVHMHATVYGSLFAGVDVTPPGRDGLAFPRHLTLHDPVAVQLCIEFCQGAAESPALILDWLEDHMAEGAPR